MKKRFGRGARLVALAGLACLPIAKGHADDVCPTYVVLPSGTVFDVAKMIDDSGSAAAALSKVRIDLLQISRYGGCTSVVNTPRHAECEEIVAAAEKAIVALESCARADSLDADMGKRRK
ncbi:hypothetical protein EVC45_41015 [Paraburkholderia sp. UYCP14C]|uniref:hypothetical protein n=1 Tax=Paraburkholderia sp. UYCP14C TaxID=2511130 RepID=UPI0010218236|nr:hypothetical protein [Paraburkholderia sp. UYCP14C]RZF24022.1 hypothetical protein EVC45_41015 [Paraburkholderia sp. UYCP14C]